MLPVHRYLYAPSRSLTTQGMPTDGLIVQSFEDGTMQEHTTEALQSLEEGKTQRNAPLKLSGCRPASCSACFCRSCPRLRTR